MTWRSTHISFYMSDGCCVFPHWSCSYLFRVLAVGAFVRFECGRTIDWCRSAKLCKHVWVVFDTWHVSRIFTRTSKAASASLVNNIWAAEFLIHIIGITIIPILETQTNHANSLQRGIQICLVHKKGNHDRSLKVNTTYWLIHKLNVI